MDMKVTSPTSSPVEDQPTIQPQDYNSSIENPNAPGGQAAPTASSELGREAGPAAAGAQRRHGHHRHHGHHHQDQDSPVSTTAYSNNPSEDQQAVATLSGLQSGTGGQKS